MAVALDTNFLLDMVRLKIDIFQQIREKVANPSFVVPQQVKKELEGIASQKGKQSTAAKVALLALEIYGVSVLPGKAKGGDAALELLSRKGVIIATSDAGLKQSLKNAPQGVLIIRQSKYVDWNQGFSSVKTHVLHHQNPRHHPRSANQVL
ncbi:MAG: hypothetical protein IPJ89_01210 [Candidatus Iainarchaeum archaeon]|uniref:VapC9 PIN-like domain-containing protein n=1 Tax=Candidatus Iainarchaeum sp. TaxID=3101447 RepID=A0A7T9DKB1_9ARCH|nr:MAG: hypothetical protein IPJ89_01210 [Candidatus Diapherotrites archaeon]